MFSFSSLIKKLGRNHFKNYYKKFVEAKNAKTLQVRRGHVPMYVGEEAKRYEVPLKYLSLPMFKELIMQSQEDHELEHKIGGPIMLACTTEMFDKLLELAKKF